MFDALDETLPGDTLAAVAARMRQRRKGMHLTQAQLAQKAGVSLASLKRFEQSHQISLQSLVKLAFALDCEADFDALFAQPAYGSIDDVIAARKKTLDAAKGSNGIR